MVEAAQELDAAPGVVQALGTAPGAPNGVAPGVVPDTKPEVVLGDPCEAKA